MTVDLTTNLGAIHLATPLVAASGTVGSVWEFTRVADPRAYGAMTAKSVSGDPWKGRPAPRLAPAGLGMLNGIGIQNPGIDAWAIDTAPKLKRVETRVWGSAVGNTPAEYARVAEGLSGAGVSAVEINLSCPNLEDGRMFALDPELSSDVVAAVRRVTELPIGAKLSPDAEELVAIAAACREAGADWLTLTNTAKGAGIDLDSRRPLLSGVIGGYSGAPLKPISLRCVIQVAQALPDVPILGCGGVMTGADVIEYLMAGASAVGLGTIHFAEPKAATRILSEVRQWADGRGVRRLADLVGTMEAS
jgi:dihydroorotate dehydrogenase (NAD+) catalytic subunit